MAEVLGGFQGLLQYRIGGCSGEAPMKLSLTPTPEQRMVSNLTKITLWKTGEGSSDAYDGTSAISNNMQRTGITPPSWLAQMGQGLSQGQLGDLVSGK
ncbi:MAG: hypothetical protein Q9217_001948 [Psora testacea]